MVTVNQRNLRNQRNVDVCCLQETKIKKGIDINVKNNRLICFPSEKSHYIVSLG